MTENGCSGQTPDQVLQVFDGYFEHTGIDRHTDPEGMSLVCRFDIGPCPASLYVLVSDEVTMISCRPELTVPIEAQGHMLALINSINGRLSIGRFVLEDDSVSFRVFHPHKLFPVDEPYARELIGSAASIVEGYAADLASLCGIEPEPEE